MSPRDKILGRVKAALGGLTQRAARPAWEPSLLAPNSASSLEAQFAERLSGVHGVFTTSWDGVAERLRAERCTKGYCAPSLVNLLPSEFVRTFGISTEYDRTRVDDYDFGITEADGAIAETGTLILSDQGTSRRLAALAPWVHVAVVRRETLLPTLAAALASMPKDPNVIWITGPSKTADVEGILIEGVHGPGVQIALLL